MLVFNVTFHIEDEVHEEAVLFLKNEYITKAVGNGMFFNPRFCLIHKAFGEEGNSYSIQFYVKNQALLNEWWSEVGERLHKEIETRFRNKMLGFTTLLEELDC